MYKTVWSVFCLKVLCGFLLSETVNSAPSILRDPCSGLPDGHKLIYPNGVIICFNETTTVVIVCPRGQVVLYNYVTETWKCIDPPENETDTTAMPQGPTNSGFSSPATGLPAGTGMATSSEIPTTPGTPGTPGMPTSPGMPASPGVPTTPNTPGSPGFTGTSTTPGTTKRVIVNPCEGQPDGVIIAVFINGYIECISGRGRMFVCPDGQILDKQTFKCIIPNLQGWTTQPTTLTEIITATQTTQETQTTPYDTFDKTTAKVKATSTTFTKTTPGATNGAKITSDALTSPGIPASPAIQTTPSAAYTTTHVQTTTLTQTTTCVQSTQDIPGAPTTPGFTSASESATTQSPIPDNDACEGKADGTILWYFRNGYWYCLYGRAQVVLCPDGQLFDIVKQDCV